MRRLGEPASPSRSWVRGNFRIALTPTRSLKEGEGDSVGPLPLPGDRGRVRGRKKENPLIEYRPQEVVTA